MEMRVKLLQQIYRIPWKLAPSQLITQIFELHFVNASDILSNSLSDVLFPGC